MDNSIIYQKGMIDDLMVYVNDLIIPIDFVISVVHESSQMEKEKNLSNPLILHKATIRIKFNNHWTILCKLRDTHEVFINIRDMKHIVEIKFFVMNLINSEGVHTKVGNM